jgi:hypothetical protein
MENEFLSLYGAKLVEYGLAVVYMILFVGYWRWVQGEPAPGTNPDPKRVGRAS